MSENFVGILDESSFLEYILSFNEAYEMSKNRDTQFLEHLKWNTTNTFLKPILLLYHFIVKILTSKHL